MISYIRGELVSIEEEKVIVDVNGVGLGIYMPKQSMTMLPAIGEDVKLHTYMNVREDAMQLFGFLTRDDLTVYKMVITVNGIGPKNGLSILSHMSADELRFAVLSQDVKAISGAPGIGKKTAEKLILELKDKLNVEDMLGSYADAGEEIVREHNQLQAEAIQALVALGYSNSEAMKAVKKVTVDETTTVESILKQALKHIMF